MNQSAHRWAVLAGCWLLYFVFGLSIAGLAPLVSEIQSDLDVSASGMGTILGAWQFVYIFSAIPVGFALQRFGASRLLALGGAIIAISGLARAHSDSYAVLLCSVAFFGLGGPIISAGIPQTVSEWFSEKERGFAMGIYITGPAVAGVVAYSSTQSVVLPWLGSDWRLVLMVWAMVALFATCAWIGIALFTRNAARAGLMHAQAGQDGRQSQSAVAVARMLLKQRNVVLLLLIGTGVFTIDHGMRNWLPEIIRSFGWSAKEAGYLSVIPVAFGIVGALSFPRLATRQRRPLVLKGLFGLAAVGCLLISFGQGGALVLGLSLLGLASGAMMTVTLLSLIEQSCVGPGNAGLAGGMFFSVAEIGGVGGPVMIGLVYDLSGGFPLALWLLSGLAAALAIAVTRVRRDP